MPFDVDSPAATDNPPTPAGGSFVPRRGKLTPAQPAPQELVLRRRLFRELEGALARRLTVVLADAGYGKSVTLGAWATAVGALWYAVGPDDANLAVFVLGIAHAFAPRVPAVSRQLNHVMQTSLGPDGDESERAAPIATLLCEALEQELRDDVVIVFDDVHELGRRGPSVRLLEEICRQAPPRLHVVLASRLDPPFPIQRLRGQGEVLDLDAAMLAFGEEEVAELLGAVLGEDATPLAPAVHELTAGWPAAVRLTAEALRPVPATARPDALGALHRPGGQLFAYVAEEVFGRVAPGVRQLLRHVALFDRFNEAFCKAIGVRAAAESLVALRRAGLFLETRDGGEWLGLHTLVREFVRERWPLGDDERTEVHRRAAAWFDAHGRYDEALDSLLAVGDLEGVAATLTAHGPQLLAAGQVEATIRIAAQLPDELSSAPIARLVGEAHEIRGEWDEALRCFERAAGTGARLDAGLAWRLGMIHHLRGRLDEALQAYERGELDRGQPRDAALLLAWKATAYWLRGDGDACRTAAEEAFALASEAADPGALAAAHNALAMLAALSGDRLSNDAHYLRALEYAERAGDVVQAVRVRTNRGSRHLEEGEYEQALAELEIAIRLAELTGFVFFRALALTNRGEVHFRLGRLEEATADLEAAKALYQRAASRMVSYPLAMLGDVYRERGDMMTAQAFYEDALAQADQSGDIQGLVPVLAALAQLLAAEDPERARSLAKRAASFGHGMAHVAAEIACGWVALVSGDREAAAASAEEAAATARIRRDRAGLAQALELSALASSDRRRQAVRLEEAVSLWRGIGSPLGEARAELFLGLTAGGPAGSLRAEQAEQRLREAGAHGYRVLVASVLPSLLPAGARPLAISTLGRFAVERAGRAVGRDEWQSKKARDLLKILVARRGRHATRDLLMEALWPNDDEPDRLSNRLSVALSTLRSVLDPERRHASDYFIAATADGVRLNVAGADVDVDVERFFEEAEQGLRLYRNGRPGDARASLEAAEERYLGDFLEEDIYDDWAAPLREEARAAYLAVTTALAELAETSRDHDAAIRYRLRILECDPYDEKAHFGVARSLVQAGRHGEAHRAYHRYVASMAEIGVEASPFPAARPAS